MGKNKDKKQGGSHLKEKTATDAVVPQKGLSSEAEQTNPTGATSVARGTGAIPKNTQISAGTSQEVRTDLVPSGESVQLTKRQKKRLRKKDRESEHQESTQKRSREEAYTPSPSEKGSAKRPRTDVVTPGSYSQAVTHKKMAVMKKNHPAQKMTSTEVETIYKIMNEAIEMLKETDDGQDP